MADSGPMFPPTARRRARAREAGTLAYSPLLARVAGAVVGGVVLALMASTAAGELGAFLRDSVRMSARDADPGAWLVRGLACAAWCIVPVAAAAAAAVVIAQLAQTRGWFALRVGRRREPTVTLRPVRGWRAGWRVLRGVVAGALAAVAIYCVWTSALGQSWGRIDSPAAIAATWLKLIVTAFGLGGAALLLVGLADLAVQRLLLERQLRMTWWERRQEQRDAERTEYPQQPQEG